MSLTEESTSVLQDSMQSPSAATSGGPRHDLQPAIQPSTAQLHTLTAAEALELMQNDTITVEEYTRALLSRIEERNDTVRAWEYLGSHFGPSRVGRTIADTILDKKLVLDQARALDSTPRDQRGPLHGIAVAIKDVINTKGFIVTIMIAMTWLIGYRYANTVRISTLPR